MYCLPKVDLWFDFGGTSLRSLFLRLFDDIYVAHTILYNIHGNQNNCRVLYGHE